MKLTLLLLLIGLAAAMPMKNASNGTNLPLGPEPEPMGKEITPITPIGPKMLWENNYDDAELAAAGGPTTISGCTMDTYMKYMNDCIFQLETNMNGVYVQDIIMATVAASCGDYDRLQCTWAGKGVESTLQNGAFSLFTLVSHVEAIYVTIRAGYTVSNGGTRGWFFSSWTRTHLEPDEFDCVTWGAPSSPSSYATPLLWLSSATIWYTTYPITPATKRFAYEKCQHIPTGTWTVYKFNADSEW